MFHWAGLFFGPVRLFFKPYQLPPSPCVRYTWARAVTFLVSGAISTCLLGAGLVRGRRHMSCDNDDSLVFALISPTSFSFLLLLPQTSSVLCALDPETFSLLLASSDFSLP